MRRLLVMLIAAAAVLFPAPAYALDLTNPLNRQPGDYGEHTIRVQVPDADWRMREVMQKIEDRVNNVKPNAVNFNMKSGLTCSRSATTYTCLHVYIKDWGYWGAPECNAKEVGHPGLRIACAEMGGDSPRIWLNRYYGSGWNQHYACHELGHALGLNHHDEHGCLDSNDEPVLWPSDAEVRAYRTEFYYR